MRAGLTKQMYGSPALIKNLAEYGCAISLLRDVIAISCTIGWAAVSW